VPQVPLLGPGNLQSFPCPLRNIMARRCTIRIVKPMNKIAAEVKVASAFPGLICHGSARFVPSTRYHLINTPTPPFFIFKTLQIISEPPRKPEIRQVACVPRLTNQPKDYS
jgi:hypothetical protein